MRMRFASFGLGLFVASSFSPVLYAQTVISGTGITHFTWSTGSEDTPMEPSNTHFCLLTGVKGNFDDGMVLVHRSSRDVTEVEREFQRDGTFGGTELDDLGDKWKLGGWADGAVSAEAMCVAIARFTADPGTPPQAVSPPFGSIIWSSPDWPADCHSTAQESMWPSDSAPFLTGVNGPLSDGGDTAFVTVASSATSPATVDLDTRTCGGSAFEARGRSYYFGNKIGTFPNYEGFMIEPLIVDPRNSSSRQMVPIGRKDFSVCGLTEIAGDFQGDGEELRITWAPIDGDGSEEWWQLLGYAGTSGGVRGKAACIAYDQRARPVIGPD
jgi:hypothetical protein